MNMKKNPQKDGLPGVNWSMWSQSTPHHVTSNTKMVKKCSVWGYANFTNQKEHGTVAMSIF